MAESEEELKSLLLKVKEESEKVGLKLALLYLKQIISKRLLRELCSIFFNNLNGKRT